MAQAAPFVPYYGYGLPLAHHLPIAAPVVKSVEIKPIEVKTVEAKAVPLAYPFGLPMVHAAPAPLLHHVAPVVVKSAPIDGKTVKAVPLAYPYGHHPFAPIPLHSGLVALETVEDKPAAAEEKPAEAAAAPAADATVVEAA